MQEALKVAQEAERAEEEAFMKRAIEESQKLDDQKKEDENEEEEMIRKAIEASMEEEKLRE